MKAQGSSEPCAVLPSLSRGPVCKESRVSPGGSRDERGHSSTLFRPRALQLKQKPGSAAYHLCNLEQRSPLLASTSSSTTWG